VKIAITISIYHRHSLFVEPHCIISMWVLSNIFHVKISPPPLITTQPSSVGEGRGGFRIELLIALVLAVRFYLEELKIEFIENPRELAMFKRHTTKEGSELVLPFCVRFNSLKGSPVRQSGEMT